MDVHFVLKMIHPVWMCELKDEMKSTSVSDYRSYNKQEKNGNRIE